MNKKVIIRSFLILVSLLVLIVCFVKFDRTVSKSSQPISIEFSNSNNAKKCVDKTYNFSPKKGMTVEIYIYRVDQANAYANINLSGTYKSKIFQNDLVLMTIKELKESIDKELTQVTGDPAVKVNERSLKSIN